jgi:hypothetical protein
MKQALLCPTFGTISRTLALGPGVWPECAFRSFSRAIATVHSSYLIPRRQVQFCWPHSGTLEGAIPPRKASTSSLTGKRNSLQPSSPLGAPPRASGLWWWWRRPPLCAPGSLSHHPRSLSLSLSPPRCDRQAEGDHHSTQIFSFPHPPLPVKSQGARRSRRRSPHRTAGPGTRAPLHQCSRFSRNPALSCRARVVLIARRRRPVRFVPGSIGSASATRSEWARPAGTGAAVMRCVRARASRGVT